MLRAIDIPEDDLTDGTDVRRGLVEVAGPRKVDAQRAHEVADCFVSARGEPGNAMVQAAYGQLEEQSDRILLFLTRPRHLGGIRVVFTRCRLPYASDREMIAAVRRSRLLEVTTAATERDQRHPLMGCEVGGAFDRFRAVHDLVGHVFPRLGFDRDGEFTAWLAQEQMHSHLARRALATELHAKHSVLWTSGQVSEHKATLLDLDLLARARQGRP